MSNFDTIDAVTENIERVLSALGISFSTETYDDPTAIPASKIPLGLVYYEDEAFEYTFGEKPSYIDAGYTIKIYLRENDPRLLAREEQKWVHLIRDGLTINALNTGALAASKLVSLVSSESVRLDHSKPGLSVISYAIKVKYREV